MSKKLRKLSYPEMLGMLISISGGGDGIALESASRTSGAYPYRLFGRSLPPSLSQGTRRSGGVIDDVSRCPVHCVFIR